MIRSKRSFLFVSLLAVTACTVSAPEKTAEAKPAKKLKKAANKKKDTPPAKASQTGRFEREAWFDFTFKGRKVGFMFARDEDTTVNGKPALHGRRWSVIVVRRGSDEVRMEGETHVWFLKDGTPLRFTAERKEGSERRSIEGYRDGKQFVVRQNVGGNVVERKIPMNPTLRLASSLEVLAALDLRDGYQAKGDAIQEDEAVVQPYDLTVKKVAGPGDARFVLDAKIGAIKALTRLDSKGLSIDSEMPQLGAVFKRVDKEQALKLDATFDIFASGQFSVQTDLPAGHKLDKLVMKLKGSSGKRPPFYEGPLQKAVKKTKDSVVLELKVAPAMKKAKRLPIKSPEARFLNGTPYESLNDEALVAAAEKLADPDQDLWKTAKAVNGFVYRHLQNKTLAKAHASASEALDAKEGDCTEHAVLFSALAKILKIPTRLVTGLVYVGGPKRLFGYHEWVEIWTGRRWLPMDPTFGQDIADPTHIKFTEGTSDPKELYDAGVVAAQLIGDLKLEVVDFKGAR